MLPAGIATSSPVVSPVAPSSTNGASSSPSSAANPGSRTVRLRGLSYLRSYTHAHNHHHSSSSSSSNNNNNNNNNNSNNNRNNTPSNTNNTVHRSANDTAVTPSPATATTATATASAASAFENSRNPASSLASSRPPRQRRATSPLNNAALNSWIPTVSVVSGLSRVVSLPAAELSTPTVHATPAPPPPDDAAHHNSAVRSIDQAISSHAPPFPLRQQASVTMNSNGSHAGLPPDNQPLPSIRFTPYIDIRSSRESLHFTPIERCLRQRDEHIRVGRASERDASNPHAPVGFSSKVVSRRHCEFWCDGGQWYVKDVKSSSGTFLNHIRLSAPGMESKAYPLNDGDILQLGIDFKGGEEQIFKCVKIRVELNRAWQKSLNNFNMSAHRRLRNLAKAGKDPDTSSLNSSECAICLLPVAPCQSLFVAPCSHVWHYKCIRPLVEKEYPTFLCPNCRAIADLEREIEEDEFKEELWEVPSPEILDPPAQNQSHSESPTGAVGAAEATTATAAITSGDAVISGPSGNGTATNAPPAVPRAVATATPNSSGAPPAEIVLPVGPRTPPLRPSRRPVDEEGASDSSGGDTGHEGPMTPMNDVGPFVLHGSQSRGRRETLFTPLGAD